MGEGGQIAVRTQGIRCRSGDTEPGATRVFTPTFIMLFKQRILIKIGKESHVLSFA